MLYFSILLHCVDLTMAMVAMMAGTQQNSQPRKNTQGSHN
jgi:hypothetical protein